MMRPRDPLLLAAALWAGCSSGQQAAEIQPMSEKVLAARKLQEPLSQHLCKAAVYPTAPAGLRATPAGQLTGRGKDFREALEALCREADGVRAQAVTELYAMRQPSGWAPIYELRGTALRYEPGAAPPPPPPFDQVPAPRAVRPGSEPAPTDR